MSSSTWLGLRSLHGLVLLLIVAIVTGETNLRDVIRRPRTFLQGEIALLTCVVREIGNNTVLWKRLHGRGDSIDAEVLTSGDRRVSRDKRYSVLHEKGGAVYVLSIHDVTMKDQGMYVCEVNSEPPLVSFHELKVAPPDADDFSTKGENESDFDLQPDVVTTEHDFSECCKASGVSGKCLGFCNLDDIMKGKTRTDPDHCDQDFPKIISCMADGRDHTPCCVDEGVPDLCLEICRGDYTVHTDNIKTHFSCSVFTSRILSCVAIGVAILPKPVENIETLPVSDTQILVSWDPPNSRGKKVPVDYYVINITRLDSFDPLIGEDDLNMTTANNSEEVVIPKAMQIKVPADRNSTEYVISNLTEYTMYEISMVSVNERGSSLPTLRRRTLTHPKDAEQPPAGAAPELPDTPGCCRENGVPDQKCVDVFCDPKMNIPASVPQMMVCAPWVPQMTQCLAQGGDHSPCCRAKGLPEPCPDLCTGNVTSIDFHYFKCIRHFSEISNCLLKGYGVLPGPPSHLSIAESGPTFGIVTWKGPELLGHTVTSYNVHYRSLRGERPDFISKENVKTPFLIDGLMPESYYEFYVEAVNDHGAGEASYRLVFTTRSADVENALDNAAYQYNVTACCVAARVHPECLEMCNYEAKMSVVKSVAMKCIGHMHAVIRCGAGGRDHTPCCQRSGVHGNCMPMCAGKLPKSLNNPSFCLGFIGNIVQCYQEGTGKFPSPPVKVHATRVTNTSVTLGWEAPEEGEFDGFQVQYQTYNAVVSRDMPVRMERSVNVSATDRTTTIDDLQANQNYIFTVIAYNSFGYSLPSSVLDLNISQLAFGGNSIDGHPAPPHSLVVLDKTATSLSIVWMPPDYSHTTETLKYRLYWRKLNTSAPAATDAIPSYNFVETNFVSAKMDNLSPNSQYVLYVVCKGEKGISGPSETLLAWTDPFYPAFVEPPTVQPASLIVEGHSVAVVCIAMGEPMPNVSLFVSGRLLRNATTRHLVHTIQNISRDMDQLSCYADNGYGTPAQASRNIIISRGPRISVPDVVLLPLGKAVKLECAIDAYPRPVMRWSRDKNDRGSSIIHGGKYKIEELDSDSGFHVMRLTVNPVKETDSGNYYCHAENAFGNDTKELVVQQRQKPKKPMNVTACCIENNVPDYCMSSCVFDLDFGAIVDDPRCISEYHKLMRCGSDDSDHRTCCTRAGVPKRCLDWCRGEDVPSAQLCLLSWTKQIINCFEEGKAVMPGKPTEIRVSAIDHNSVSLSWNPPKKNAYAIEIYRVYWRPHGGFIKSEMKETKDLSTRIDGLKDELTYEVAVKAGNHYGSSQLSETLLFTTTQYPTSNWTAGAVVVGVVIALIIVVSIISGVICYVRKDTRFFVHKTLTESVSFENPSYMREGDVGNNQSVQNNESCISVRTGSDYAMADTGANNQSDSRRKAANGNGVPLAQSPWKDEALYPSEQEPAEGLNVSEGYKSVGFQKFQNEL